MGQPVSAERRFVSGSRTPRDMRALSTRFPAPWRIVEIPNGFAVDDASGQQLGVFYGRADPNTAGHTGFLTIEEAHQMAVDFARLPELLERTSGSQRGREKPRLSAEQRCKS
jgi:hypothetical protein